MDRKQTNKITQDQSLTSLRSSSSLASGNAAYLEEIYEQFLRDPATVSAQWRRYFENLPRVNGIEGDVSHTAVREEFRRIAHHRQSPVPAGREATSAATAESAHNQVKVLQLINAYRYRAHQLARLDPLGLREAPNIPELDLRYYGFGEAELDAVFETGSLVGPRQATLPVSSVTSISWKRIFRLSPCWVR